MSLKSLKFHSLCLSCHLFFNLKVVLDSLQANSNYIIQIYEYSKSHKVYNYFMFMKMNSMASQFPVDEKMSSLRESS